MSNYREQVVPIIDSIKEIIKSKKCSNEERNRAILLYSDCMKQGKEFFVVYGSKKILK